MVHAVAVLEQRDHRGLVVQALVAGKVGHALELHRAALLGPELAGGAGALALRLHLAVEARLVHFQGALARDIRGQVERETVGIVELEQQVAGNQLAVELVDGLVEDAHTLLYGLGETRLLHLEYALDVLLGPAQLRVGLAHLFVQGVHQGIKERLLLTQLVAVADGTTDDPAQYIAPPFVAGQHAVHHQEGAGTDVIGDHAQRLGLQVFGAGGLGRRLDQRLE